MPDTPSDDGMPYVCDQCGAHAYVEVYLRSFTSPLLWCAHHYRPHEARFNEEALLIVDNRHLILG